MRMIRAAAAALLLLPMAAVPAAAVAPGNDDSAGRQILSDPLPISWEQDTSEATLGAEDADFVAGCGGAPPTEASVWFEYTPTQTGGLILDMSASSYTAGAVIATGNATDGWWVQSCGPGTIGWGAEAGVTYTVLVFEDYDTPDNGGTLRMTIDVIPPPPTLEVTINPSANFNSKTGEATVTGRATCTAAPGQEDMAFAFLDMQLTQRIGRMLIRGWGGTEVTCDGTDRPWEVVFVAGNGLFKGGKAANLTYTYACGAMDCAVDFIETTVQLKGGTRR